MASSKSTVREVSTGTVPFSRASHLHLHEMQHSKRKSTVVKTTPLITKTTSSSLPTIPLKDTYKREVAIFQMFSLWTIFLQETLPCRRGWICVQVWIGLFSWGEDLLPIPPLYATSQDGMFTISDVNGKGSRGQGQPAQGKLVQSQRFSSPTPATTPT